MLCLDEVNQNDFEGSEVKAVPVKIAEKTKTLGDKFLNYSNNTP